MIHAIVFDLGHTLWDIAPPTDDLERAYDAFHARLAKRVPGSLPSAAEIRLAVAEQLRADREVYGADAAASTEQPPTYTWVERALASLGVAAPVAVLRELSDPLFSTEIERLVCAPGTREAVAALRDEGYRLGCVTNTLAPAGAIRDMLRRHGFDALMETVVVSSQEGYRKPHASLFEKAMRALDAQPNQSIFVGDSPVHDIAGAKRAGMWAVLTTQYVARPYQDYAPLPDAVIGHVRDLRGIVPSLAAKR